ncbi:MAG TPA: hypothetical protein VMH78_02615 [Thermoplasmata archaeon]|nr:hypothetical protein [Thermoplasmata archaeon]
MRRVRAVRPNRWGLSEIVGALMLVLIVVSAATAFAAFAASYQKQLQAEQQVTQERSLESLVVLHAQPTLSLDGSHYVEFDFTLASLSLDTSYVTSISVNHQELERYNATGLNLTTGLVQSWVVGSGEQLDIGARDQITIGVDLNVADADYSPYTPGFVLHDSDYVQLDAFTYYDNDFTKVFIPPTAIPIVTQLETGSSGGGLTIIPVLDGSHSFQSGNATIVSWSWAVTSGGTTTMYSGELAEVPGGLHSGDSIVLTVTNSDGLLGVSAPLVYT